MGAKDVLAIAEELEDAILQPVLANGDRRQFWFRRQALHADAGAECRPYDVAIPLPARAEDIGLFGIDKMHLEAPRAPVADAAIAISKKLAYLPHAKPTKSRIHFGYRRLFGKRPIGNALCIPRAQKRENQKS